MASPTQYSAQLGLPLTENGFATLTAEWRSADPTSRSVQRDDAAAAAAAGYPGVRDPAQIWGSPEVNEDMKFVANFGISGENVDVYGFGNYAKRDVEGGFYYRNPTAAQRRVLERRRQDAADRRPRHRQRRDLPDHLAARRRRQPDPLRHGRRRGRGAACRMLHLPLAVPGRLHARSSAARWKTARWSLGAKGVWGEGWHWDLSGSYGRNEIEFYMLNTVNASMGPDQPAEQPNSRPAATSRPRPASTSMWAMTSRPASPTADRWPWRWARNGARKSSRSAPATLPRTAIGPLTDQGFSIGSNGFPASTRVPPASSRRDNWAVYVDAEAPFTDKFLMAAAVRYEDFSDFGGTTNWKLTGRYDFNDNFAMRGAVSTGFRAPTPGQANAEPGDHVVHRRRAARHRDACRRPMPIAAFYGAAAADARGIGELLAGPGLERRSAGWSRSTGTTSRSKTASRCSNDFTVSEADRDALVAAGIPRRPRSAEVRFFVNDFDTTTSGLDLVASYRQRALRRRHHLLAGGQLERHPGR